MKRILFLFNILMSISLLSYEVGHFSKIFIDESRNNREIITEIFFPFHESGNITFPVLIFGHGWLLNYNYYSSFTEEMASYGFIVVFPRTEEVLVPNHEDFALDIDFLLGAIQLENNNSSSNLYNIVMNETFAMGHSMGGACAVLAADYSDNFSGIINFAAAETNPSAIESAQNVNLPSLMFSASNDNVAPPNTNQLPIYENLNSEIKYFISLVEENHMNITANSNISTIIIPFMNFIITDDEYYLTNCHSILDSLKANNYLDFFYENSVNISENALPDFYSLRNYPNPFNPVTTIDFFLEEEGNVNLSIYNTTGKLIKKLINKNLSSGKKTFVWNGKNTQEISVSSGIYFYKLEIDGKMIDIKKMSLLR